MLASLNKIMRGRDERVSVWCGCWGFIEWSGKIQRIKRWDFVSRTSSLIYKRKENSFLSICQQTSVQFDFLPMTFRWRKFSILSAKCGWVTWPLKLNCNFSLYRLSQGKLMISMPCSGIVALFYENWKNQRLESSKDINH